MFLGKFHSLTSVTVLNKQTTRGISYSRMTRKLRKRARSEIKVKEEDIATESKYFKKTKVKQEFKEEEDNKVLLEDAVDIEWVKTLNNKDYFNWIGERTGNVPNRWGNALSEDAFIPLNGYKLPKYFKYIYTKLRRLRSQIKAPVDTVGGSSVSITVANELGIAKEEIEPRNYRFQTLVGIMLSSQTKDEVTAKGMYNITKYCLDKLNTRGITLEAMLQIDEPTLDELIRSVGFHTRKAKYITQTCQILVEQHGSEIPTTPEAMLALPGVGPKMTYLTLQKAWGRIDGICVDVHVDRLCKLFKWVDPKKCKNPDNTRQALQNWLPHPLWREINSLLVGYGQAIDRPKSMRSAICSTEESDEKHRISPVDPEILEMVQSMSNYQSWVNYMVRDAKNHEQGSKNNDIIKKEETDEVPLVKLQDNISITSEIKLENKVF